MSTLPLPHILGKSFSQLTIPPRTIAIIPTAFNGIPKPNSHYSLIEPLAPHESQQHLNVPVLKMFGEKLPLCSLCTVINMSSDEVVFSKKKRTPW